MMISSLLKSRDWTINDQPEYFPGICDNPQDYVTWSDVEWCLNNPQFYDIKFINRNTNNFIEYPKYPRFWSEDHADPVDMMNIFAEGHTCIIEKFEWIDRKRQDILKELEEYFPKIVGSFHIYAGIGECKSFKVHEDYANNFILQVEGETHWKVYNNRCSNLLAYNLNVNEDDLDCAIDVIMKPGDVLYIPVRHYHWAQPSEKRLSCSIPMQHLLPYKKTVDRKYYALPH